MTSAFSALDNETAQEVRALLMDLQGVPPLRAEKGVLQALLGNSWYPVSEIRKLVDQEVLIDLERRGVSWSWLVSRSSEETQERTEWTELLEQSARRPWITAEFLFASVQDALPVEELAQGNEVIDQIHAALASFAFSLKARRSTEIRRRGVRLFRIWSEHDKVLGMWDSASRQEALDLEPLLRTRAQIATQLSEDAIRRITSAFFEQVLSADAVVPGFVVERSDRRSEIVWKLAPRNKEEAIEQLLRTQRAAS